MANNKFVKCARGSGNFSAGIRLLNFAGLMDLRVLHMVLQALGHKIFRVSILILIPWQASSPSLHLLIMKSGNHFF